MGFFPVVCLAKCYQLHPSSIIHALASDLGQMRKLQKLQTYIEEFC